MAIETPGSDRMKTGKERVFFFVNKKEAKKTLLI
jgi:hypothetical protein